MRAQHDILQQARENGALLVQLAGDNPLGADDLTVLIHILHELGDVVEHIHALADAQLRAHVVGQPAPHLHVGAQALGVLAELGGLSVLRQRLDVELAQALELFVLRV